MANYSQKQVTEVKRNTSSTESDVTTEIQKVVQINRVSKKTAGGNRFRFSAVVVVGDGAGSVGVGKGSAPNVTSAISKAANFAKKHQIKVSVKNGTISYKIFQKLGAAKVLLKPAPAGAGLIAGGAVRAVVQSAGISNISSKILGTKNKASNVYATFEALSRLAK